MTPVRSVRRRADHPYLRWLKQPDDKDKIQVWCFIRLLSADTNAVNLIAKLKKIIEILKKAYEAVATTQEVSGCVCMTSRNIFFFFSGIGGRRPNPPQ